MMDYKHLDEIEEHLLDMAIDDPIGFRTWFADFSAYVENKLEELVEKSMERIKLLKEMENENENE